MAQRAHYYLPTDFAGPGTLSLPGIGGDGVGFSHWLRLDRHGAARRLTFDGDDDPTFAIARDAVLRPRDPLPGFIPGRTAVMGIVNVTPDSFSDGGAFASAEAALSHGRALAEAGADVLDVGGESTRPGAEPISEDEELARVIPVIEGLARSVSIPISVDTRKAVVMEQAAAAGASIVNDVSALSHDDRSLETVAALGCPVILMHARGEPRMMQHDPVYDHVLLDVFDALEQRIEACVAAGIARDRLVVDPGIGFGKTLEHNLALLHGLALFHTLGCPIVLGASRKSFIGRLSGTSDPLERLAGSLAVACHAFDRGVQMIRVHDVAETVQARAVWQAMRDGSLSEGPQRMKGAQ